MSTVRLLLLILCTAVADFSTPLVPEAMEAFEESDEATHRKRRPRFLRPAGEAVVPVTVRVAAVAMVETSRRALVVVRPVGVVDAPLKAPPPTTASPLAPEDH